MLQNLQNSAKFQNFQLDNLVDFEKCCKTRICLQRSAPVQPKTSENLPNICHYKISSRVGPDAGSAFVERTKFDGPGRPRDVRLDYWQNWQVLQNFANFWRARSRLYQNEILQESMRSTAFFKLYKICILLHRCTQKFRKKSV